MIQSKKGAELSLTVIIIAIILLIVLVVVAVIFSSKINVFGKTTVDCNTQGGYCANGEAKKGIDGETVYICKDEGATTIQNTNCPSGQACCLPILR